MIDDKPFLAANPERTSDRFYSLVKKMRKAQCEYFACKCPSRLARAKKLERLVDDAVREYDAGKGPQQNTLF